MFITNTYSKSARALNSDFDLNSNWLTTQSTAQFRR